MKPVNFEASNVNLQKPENMTDEECSNLHIFTDGQICVSCWEMTLWERIKVLFRGKMWLMVWSGHTQPPVCLTADNPISMEESK